MEFVNPGILYGLFAVSIPVIIHLFNFRRFRKVYFTNVEFIKELKQETQKQSRLKHLIVLLMRMLAIVMLVFVFARPYIPVSENLIQPHKHNNISIYIDNSFSMQADSEKGILMNNAIEKAREIASVYKSSDRFSLLTNDFEGRHQRFVSKEEFLDLLDEVAYTPIVRNFNEVVLRQTDLQKMEPAVVKTSFLISDFQEHFLMDPIASDDTSLNTWLIPVQSLNADNVYIDSCWFESPVQQTGQNVKLNVGIQNSSKNQLEKIPAKLVVNGSQKAIASFDIGPDSEKTIELFFTNQSAGIQQGVLEINDYPVSFDDKFYFSYYVSPFINVLSINGNGENFYLNSLFRNDTVIRFENVHEGRLDYSSLQNFELIVLNELISISSGLSMEIHRFVENGGHLLVVPSIDIDLASYNEMLGAAGVCTYAEADTGKLGVSYINLDHPLYNGVFDDPPENMDLPDVHKHYILRVPSRSTQEKLMELQNGDLFLNTQAVGQGRVYISAVPLNPDFSEFPQHPLFVPTLYKMAVSSIAQQELYYTIGENELIRIESANRQPDEIYTIKKDDDMYEFIPEVRKTGHSDELFVHGQVIEAGNYSLISSGQRIEGLSFNFNRTESEMIFNSPDEIETILKDNNLYNVSLLQSGKEPFVQTLTDMSRGIQLWKWFVLAALLFLLGEVVLLRLWKS